VRIRRIRARLRTKHRAVQRGPTAQGFVSKPVRTATAADPTTLTALDALAAFAAALLTFRLAGLLAVRWRERRRPELAVWSAALLCYAIASAALAWSTAAEWSNESFRVFYLFGGLLTAALLGTGSLVLTGVRWALPVALVYAGVAIGVAIAVPLDPPITGTDLPHSGEHLALFPARVIAIGGNTIGTLAVIAIALRTLRRRPLGNALVVAGVALAGGGTGLLGYGIAVGSVAIVLAALLLYAGFVVRR
jgi:hypothetical protein